MHGGSDQADTDPVNLRGPGNKSEGKYGDMLNFPARAIPKAPAADHCAPLWRGVLEDFLPAELDFAARSSHFPLDFRLSLAGNDWSRYYASLGGTDSDSVIGARM